MFEFPHLPLEILGIGGQFNGRLYRVHSQGGITGGIMNLGTSLPEIISATMSAYRGHGELALGTVFGSNIFNILMVLGVTASVKELHILEPIHPDLLFTTGLTCLLLVLIRLEHKLSKRDGIILLTAYLAYMVSKGMGLI